MKTIKYSAEIRKLAKRANQRMVEMERHGYKSPAYKAVQSALEMLGKRSDKAGGRRFSETGKGTENELRQLKAELTKFLGHQTSTIKGYKKYRKDVYEGADKKFDLKKAGISQKDFEEMYDTLPDKEKDRLYYAAYYIEVLETYEMKLKTGQIKRENELTITDIMRIMQSKETLKDALKEIGITTQDIEHTKKLLGE